MKAKFLMAICATALFAVSCGGSEVVAPDEPEKVADILYREFYFNKENEDFIGLFKYDARYDVNLPVEKVEAKIIGGSGNYTIIPPEEIICKYWGDEVNPVVPYSEDILKVWLDGDIIHIERVMPLYNPDGSGQELWIEAKFILKDGKGQQKAFWVQTIEYVGDFELLQR